MSNHPNGTANGSNGNGSGVPLVSMKNIGRRFGTITALDSVDFEVGYAEIVGLLGDNGAGKSTLIKVLTGVHPPTSGQIYFEGQPVSVNSPQDARDLGIETVYQDLALVPLMSIARNFYLGREPTKRMGPIPVIDEETIAVNTGHALDNIGIHIRGAEEPVGTLSGGERQSIAIGRAVHFGTKLLIMDEPTSALSIGETRKVIEYIQEAKRRGMSVIFITHNIHHVFEVADRFTIISRGQKVGDFRKAEVSQDEIAGMIMGEPVPETLINRAPLVVNTRVPEQLMMNSAIPKQSRKEIEVTRSRRALLTYGLIGIILAFIFGATFVTSRPKAVDSSAVPPLVNTVFGQGFSLRVPEAWKTTRSESGTLFLEDAGRGFKMQIVWDSARNRGVSPSRPLAEAAKKLQDDDFLGWVYKPGTDVKISGANAYRYEKENTNTKRLGVDYITFDPVTTFIDVQIDGPAEGWETSLKPLAETIMASFVFR